METGWLNAMWCPGLNLEQKKDSSEKTDDTEQIVEFS